MQYVFALSLCFGIRAFLFGRVTLFSEVKMYAKRKGAF